MSRKAFVRRAGSAQRLCKAEHSDYAYEKRVIVGKDDASHMDVSVYEIPPGKAAYPYHYHAGNEEVFFILSGAGLLRTPEGERTVTAGDFLYFPNNENGAIPKWFSIPIRIKSGFWAMERRCLCPWRRRWITTTANSRLKMGPVIRLFSMSVNRSAPPESAGSTRSCR
jgi:quercetin dioxygenase-like cupin family protein